MCIDYKWWKIKHLRASHRLLKSISQQRVFNVTLCHHFLPNVHMCIWQASFKSPSKLSCYQPVNYLYVEMHLLVLIVVDSIKLSTENSRQKQLASSVEVLTDFWAQSYWPLNSLCVEMHLLVLIVVDSIKLSTENSRRKQLASSVEVLTDFWAQSYRPLNYLCVQMHLLVLIVVDSIKLST